MVTLYYSSGHSSRFKYPDPGGFYEFSLATHDTVPIGTHRLVAKFGSEELTRWVTVAPRSRTIVDFRFNKLFRNQLRMAGQPTRTSGNDGFLINIVNDGVTDDTISWLRFADTPADSAYMRNFAIGGNPPGGQFPVPAGRSGLSKGDTAFFSALAVQPDMSEQVQVQFLDFWVDSLGEAAHTNVSGKVFTFIFSDGSEITVKP